MSRRGLLLAALAVAGAVQLLVPVSMILGRERTLREGTEWRFRTAPVDPEDAFRGRFLALSFAAATPPLPAGAKLDDGQWIYAALHRDADGFAALGPIAATRPRHGDYLRARLQWIETRKDERLAHLDLPFDRFYLDESAAPAADAAFGASQRGANPRPAWAVVRVRAGDAVLEDVVVDGRSLRAGARQTPPGPPPTAR